MLDEELPRRFAIGWGAVAGQRSQRVEGGGEVAGAEFKRTVLKTLEDSGRGVGIVMGPVGADGGNGDLVLVALRGELRLQGLHDRRIAGTGAPALNNRGEDLRVLLGGRV